jgi:hypothetical protein
MATLVVQALNTAVDTAVLFLIAGGLNPDTKRVAYRK